MRKLNQKSLDFIDDVIYTHKNRRGPIKLILHDIQNEMGYIPFEAMQKMSEELGVPVSKIYGVVTFYSQFTTVPKGKHVISVCLGTACYVNGSQTILDLLVEMTGAQSKIEAFLNMLDGYEILELARTGITALSRGCDDVAWFD